MDIHPFHFEQYKMLREEIMNTMKEIYQTETYAAIAVAGIYTWFFLHKTDIPNRIIWFVPPCLIVLSGIYCLILNFRMQDAGKYLRKIEGAIFQDSPKLPGWEHHRMTHRWIDKIGLTFACLAWGIGFVGSVVLSIWASGH